MRGPVQHGRGDRRVKWGRELQGSHMKIFGSSCVFPSWMPFFTACPKSFAVQGHCEVFLSDPLLTGVKDSVTRRLM